MRHSINTRKVFLHLPEVRSIWLDGIAFQRNETADDDPSSSPALVARRFCSARHSPSRARRSASGPSYCEVRQCLIHAIVSQFKQAFFSDCGPDSVFKYKYEVNRMHSFHSLISAPYPLSITTIETPHRITTIAIHRTWRSRHRDSSLLTGT